MGVIMFSKPERLFGTIMFFVFMWVVGFVFAMNIFSCGRTTDNTTTTPFEDLQAKRNNIVKTYAGLDLPKCDYATMAVIYNAFGGHADISGLESPGGKWNRNSLPCYPNES